MTLLELLRQELPKRGGWPEGVRYITQDNGFSTYKGTICGYDSLPKFNGEIWLSDELCQHAIKPMKMDVIADDHATAIITREQYEVTSWDGTGLPPVGCECEVKRAFDWVKCKILFISDTHVVLMADEECCWNTCACQFRPLRTEAERAIDEMVQLSGVSTGAAKILYDAGYRKG